MKLLLCVQFLWLLKLIVATEYSVTIMNDSKLGDKQGAVHTWLVFNRGNNKDYFSFESRDHAGFTMAGFDTPGKCTDDDHIKERPASESETIDITEAQYNQLIEAKTRFCQLATTYDLIPNGIRDDPTIIAPPVKANDYNCVTASNAILQVANIDILRNCQTPYNVKSVITKQATPVGNAASGVVGFLRRYYMSFAQYNKPEVQNPQNQIFYAPRIPGVTYT